MIEILDNPYVQDCLQCKMMEKWKKDCIENDKYLSIFLGYWDENIEASIIEVPRYCSRCGKRIFSEQEWREMWKKVSEHCKDDFSPYVIEGELFSEELIKEVDKIRKANINKHLKAISKEEN